MHNILHLNFFNCVCQPRFSTRKSIIVKVDHRAYCSCTALHKLPQEISTGPRKTMCVVCNKVLLWSVEPHITPFEVYKLVELAVSLNDNHANRAV